LDCHDRQAAEAGIHFPFFTLITTSLAIRLVFYFEWKKYTDMNKRLSTRKVFNTFHRPAAMRLVLAFVLLVSITALPFQTLTVKAASLAAISASCSAFSQVNDSAFGMGTGADSSYSSEEGFEVLVFNNQLYVGMEADNSFGARIWRTKSGVLHPTSQADWQEVAADSNGYPFGVSNITQNDHIDSLASFNNFIYASTANGGTSKYGTRIFRSATGAANSWEDAITAYGAGFGDVYNTNFKDMQVFQGYLCGGTQNWNVGAQVWCTADGTTWTQKNVSGFGATYYNNRNVEVWSGFVFNNALYFGVQSLGALRSDTTDDVGKVYRTTSLNGTPTWSEVFTGEAASHRADILGELDGYLYVSTRSAGGIAIFRSPSGDAGTWTQVNIAGMDGNTNNIYSVVDNAAVYDDILYLAVSNTVDGLELWRTSGTPEGDSLVDWEQVSSNGLGDTKNIHAQLVTFNDNLYAWTSNYSTGQEVLYTTCGEGIPAATNTPTATATNTPTATATNTPTATATKTPTATVTNTPLPTATNTPLPTATNTPLPTAINTPLPTATNTSLPTATNTALPTETNTPVPAATNTIEPTVANTAEPTATNTPQPTSTNTQIPVVTDTPEPTATVTTPPQPSETPTPTATTESIPSETPVNTETPYPSMTNTPEPTPTDVIVTEATPEPTATEDLGDIPGGTTSTETPEPTPTLVPTSEVVWPPVCLESLEGCYGSYPYKYGIFLPVIISMP